MPACWPTLFFAAAFAHVSCAQSPGRNVPVNCDSLAEQVVHELNRSPDSSSATLFGLVVNQSPCFDRCLYVFEGKGGRINFLDAQNRTMLDAAMITQNPENIIQLMYFGGSLNEVTVSNKMRAALAAHDERKVRHLLYRKTHSLTEEIFTYEEVWPTLSAGYLQGTWGMPQVSFAMNYHRFDYIPLSHFGYRAGMLLGFPDNPVQIAPYLCAEYRYVVFIGRVGAMLPFQRGTTYISPYTEVGLSLFSLLDVTWMYAYAANGTHNRTKGSYINVQLSIPLRFLEIKKPMQSDI